MSYQSFLLVVLVLAVSYCVSNAFRVLPTAAGRSMMRARLSTPNTDAAATPVPVPTPIDPANMTLKQRLQSDMKDAMRSKEKVKLAAIRAIQSAIKQKEIDDRIDVE